MAPRITALSLSAIPSLRAGAAVRCHDASCSVPSNSSARCKKGFAGLNSGGMGGSGFFFAAAAAEEISIWPRESDLLRRRF